MPVYCHLSVSRWTDEKDTIAQEGPCNIPIRDSASLSQVEFIQSYAYKQPLIIQMPASWNQVIIYIRNQVLAKTSRFW